MKPKYEIGDKVWIGTFDSSEAHWVECPLCCGEGRLRVILGSGESVSIDCECCSDADWGQHRGTVLERRPATRADIVTITGMEINTNQVNYHYNGVYSNSGNSYHSAKEEKIFSTKDDALKHAEEMRDTYLASQQDQLERKMKPDKTWAWHVQYHRREAKRHEKDAKYHHDALNVASLKAKVEVPK